MAKTCLELEGKDTDLTVLSVERYEEVLLHQAAKRLKKMQSAELVARCFEQPFESWSKNKQQSVMEIVEAEELLAEKAREVAGDEWYFMSEVERQSAMDDIRSSSRK